LALIGSCAVMSAPKYDEQQAMTKRIRPEATPIPHGISSTPRSIVDAHMHLYDSRAVRYGVFERRDPTFEALVGDYSGLPRTYGLDDTRYSEGPLRPPHAARARLTCTIVNHHRP